MCSTSCWSATPNCSCPGRRARPTGQLDLDGDAVDADTPGGSEALAVDRLVEPLRAAMEARGLQALYADIEIPLVRVLARMEAWVSAWTAKVLSALHDTWPPSATPSREDPRGRWRGVQRELHPQLREMLFDRLGLAPQKKTKTGYSTDAASLEKLSGEHPIVDQLLRVPRGGEAAVHLRRGAAGRGGR